MKNTLLVASLLAIMSASAMAQTAPAATAKPGAAPAAATTPAIAPSAPVHRLPDPEQMAKSQIARFDTNKDSKVSLEEFLKPANSNFKRIDLNNDGFVTASELVEANKRQMAEMTKQLTKMSQPVAPAAAKAAEKPAK